MTYSTRPFSAGKTLAKASGSIALAALLIGLNGQAFANEGSAPGADIETGQTLEDSGKAAFTPNQPQSAPGQAQTGAQGEQPNAEEMQMMLALANSVFAGDFITVGAGIGLIPSYEGSDNYILFPGPQIVGQVSGFQFSSPGGGPGLVVDLVRDNPLAKTDFIAGPLVRVNLNRAIQSQINDPVVEALGDLDTAIEVGGRIGIAINGIFGRFDSISVLTDISFDVAGAHSGTIISPSINYRRPIGRAAFIRFGISADWVDDDYAQFYYGVDGTGSLASGLPVFDAEGGVKSVSANTIITYDLSGNALDGGWGVFGLAGYSRLREAAAETPITAIRGDANQFRSVVGVSYTF